MTHKTKPITVDDERVIAVLNAYGADPQAWPEAERGAIQQYIDTSDFLQKYQERAREFDALLLNRAESENHPSPEALAERILHELPPHPVASARPGLSSYLACFKRPPVALAFATIFALGIGLGVTQFQPRETLTPTLFENWAWNEITGQPLQAPRETETAGFLDMIDLELDDTRDG